jgi:hypothetical protein
MEFYLIYCSPEATEIEPGTAHNNRQLLNLWAVLSYPFRFSDLLLAAIRTLDFRLQTPDFCILEINS